MERPEILAPAGSFEAFTSAVYNGCDAVYLGGGEFGARAYANNFDHETLREAVRIGHLYDVKIFYTLNTLVKERELEHLLETVNELRVIGVDAVIVQDLGIMSILQQYFKDVEVHASTQVNCHSIYGIRFLQGLDISRTVLAREVSLKEIKSIKQKTTMPIETFVHGALCYCSSGQCLMSSMQGGRSGNRGRCAQPCRLSYKTVIDNHVVGEGYILSPKDIETLTILPELVDAGIDSFKIEGRMKSKEYVGLMTRLYSTYVNQYLDRGSIHVTQEDIRDMNQIFNRGSFSNGYYHQYNGPDMITGESPKHQGLVVGKVDKLVSNKMFITLFEDVNKGDCLEVTRRNGARHSFVLKKAYSKGNVSLFEKISDVDKGTDIRRIKNVSLNQRLNDYETNVVKNYVHMHIVLKVSKPIALTISNKSKSITVYGDVVQSAMKQGLSTERIEKQFLKMGDYPLMIEDVSIEMDDNVFMPIGQLNHVRRIGLEEWFDLNKPAKEPLVLPKKVVTKNVPSVKKNITVLLKNVEQLEAVLSYSVKRVYLEWFSFNKETLQSSVLKLKEKNIEVYIAIPKLVRNINTTMLELLIEDVSAIADGYLIRSIDAYGFIRAYDLTAPIQWDYGINIFNNNTINYLKSLGDYSGYCPSPELNKHELSELTLDDAEYTVYGHIRTMTTVQCIRKNTTGCVKDPSKIIYLEDRKQVRVPVETVCQLCYNNLYNGIPLYLIDKIRELNALGLSNFRIDFLNEQTSDVHAVMNAVESDTAIEWHKAFTRGHYNKGVE